MATYVGPVTVFWFTYVCTSDVSQDYFLIYKFIICKDKIGGLVRHHYAPRPASSLSQEFWRIFTHVNASLVVVTIMCLMWNYTQWNYGVVTLSLLCFIPTNCCFKVSVCTSVKNCRTRQRLHGANVAKVTEGCCHFDSILFISYYSTASCLENITMLHEVFGLHQSWQLRHLLLWGTVYVAYVVSYCVQNDCWPLEDSRSANRVNICMTWMRSLYFLFLTCQKIWKYCLNMQLRSCKIQSFHYPKYDGEIVLLTVITYCNILWTILFDCDILFIIALITSHPTDSILDLSVWC